MVHTIPTVTNNLEKSEAYKNHLARFKQARDQGFYFEGIFILYAMMEDRLLAFLYYAGIANDNREKITTNENVQPLLGSLTCLKNQNDRSLRGIHRKIDIIQEVLTRSISTSIDQSDQTYDALLACQLKMTARVDELPGILAAMLTWCNARNELTHALLNKNLENQAERLHLLIDEGYEYCRKFDNFVRSFKTRNTIRKKFNIQ